MPATDAVRPAHALLGLRGIALLRGCSDETLAEVAAACRFQRVRARQTVIARDDPDCDCFLVLSGHLRVVALSPGGRELSFRDALAGETIGELSALTGHARSATVLALQESLLGRLGAPDLKALMRRHWPIAERMLEHLADSARALTARVYEVSALTVQQRLCAELTRLALAADAAAHDRVALHAPPTHHELAMRISSYREQVTREFAALARMRLVSRERGQIVIEDLPRLARLGDASRLRAA
jgi:CRP/FNR family cyclic AMP-dependent transcriptional regulator